MSSHDEQYDEAETARRAEAALLRALSTPHKRQSEMKIGKRKRGMQLDSANQGRSRRIRRLLADVASGPGD